MMPSTGRSAVAITWPAPSSSSTRSVTCSAALTWSLSMYPMMREPPWSLAKALQRTPKKWRAREFSSSGTSTDGISTFTRGTPLMGNVAAVTPPPAANNPATISARPRVIRLSSNILGATGTRVISRDDVGGRPGYSGWRRFGKSTHFKDGRAEAARPWRGCRRRRPPRRVTGWPAALEETAAHRPVQPPGDHLPQRPWAPQSPVRRRVQSLVSQLLVQEEALILLILRLSAHVEAVAHVGVGVDVVRGGPLPPNSHLPRRKCPEICGLLRRVGHRHLKAGGRQHLLD